MVYEQPVRLPFETPMPIYGSMLGIWQLRPWLQRRFPLQNGDRITYLKFLAWCTLHGRREYQVLNENSQWNSDLGMPARLPAIRAEFRGEMFSSGMCLLGFAQYDENFWPMLNSAPARKRFWRWYWRSLRMELGLSVPGWQQKRIARHYEYSIEKFLLDFVARRERKIVRDNPVSLIDKYGLQDIFDQDIWDSGNKHRVNAENDRENISHGVEFTPALLAPGEQKYWGYLKSLPVWPNRLLRLKQTARTGNPAFDEETSVVGQIAAIEKTGVKVRYPFGVNLIGYARGELGQGEDVRMLSQTLELAGIPHCVVNVQPGDNISQNDNTVGHLLSNGPEFAINILCMTGIESLRFYLQNSREVFEGRYTVGLWPWELPDWPGHWSHVYSLVDEIWAISDFTSRAFRSAPVPVSPVPLPVSVEPITVLTRENFGLPEDSYLFIFSFDLASTLTRKNPAAVIEAFLQAFPHGQTGPRVGLVLKINNVERLNMPWRSLKRRIATDPRIKVIESSLRRPEVLALYNCCDCFVSLHRSEGFGRSIVESLMLGLDVIATAYSGNMEYADAEGLHLVDYELVPLGKEDYFLSQGQSWAEPSVSNAAKVMQQLVHREGLDKTKKCFDRYMPEKVSSFYKNKLQNIFEKAQ